MQYLGYCTVCNSFNPSHLFNPKHRKLTPNKDKSAIRVTPLSLLFSLCLSATQKNKKLSLSSDLSLPKIQKLSHTIAQSPWLQLVAIASHTSTTDEVPVHFCLSPSATGGAIVGATTTGGRQVLLSFSFIFLFVSFCICLLDVSGSLRVLFSDWVSF